MGHVAQLLSFAGLAGGKSLSPRRRGLKQGASRDFRSLILGRVDRSGFSHRVQPQGPGVVLVAPVFALNGLAPAAVFMPEPTASSGPAFCWLCPELNIDFKPQEQGRTPGCGQGSWRPGLPSHTPSQPMERHSQDHPRVWLEPSTVSSVRQLCASTVLVLQLGSRDPVLQESLWLAFKSCPLSLGYK